MPPVDQIKKFEVDPFSLQIEAQEKQEPEIEVDDKDDESVKIVEGEEEKEKPSAWKIREP